MLPFTVPGRAVVAAAAAAALAAVLASAAGARDDGSVSVVRVQALTRGKPLVSGRLNVIAVRNPFGFSVALRNDSPRQRKVGVEISVRYDRHGEAPLVLRTVGTIHRGTVILPVKGAKQVLFAQRARLTVSATDTAHHTTATRHYAVIFALG